MSPVDAPSGREISTASGTVGRAARAKILVFRVGSQLYGLDHRRIGEVLPMAELVHPASLPNVLAGFLRMDGSLVPVLRLDRLFGMPESSPGMYTPLVVLRSAETPLALLVDQVIRMESVAFGQVHAVPTNHLVNDCAEGVLSVDGQVVLILSAERILLEKEQQCLAELQDREHTRLRELEAPLR